MIIGQCLLGLFIPFGLVLSLPTMVEFANSNFPGQENHVNNMSAGMFNTFMGLGEVIGTIYGALLFDHLGFRGVCDSISIICFSYALIFFLFGLSDNVVKPEEADVTLFDRDYNSKNIINKEKQQMRKRTKSNDIDDDKSFKSESLLSVSDKEILQTPNQHTNSTRDSSPVSHRSDSVRHRQKK